MGEPARKLSATQQVAVAISVGLCSGVLVGWALARALPELAVACLRALLTILD